MFSFRPRTWPMYAIRHDSFNLKNARGSYNFVKKRRIYWSECSFEGLTQSSLKRRFVSCLENSQPELCDHAKRLENIAFFVRRTSLDPLWRDGPDQAFLQPTWIAASPATTRVPGGPARRLSSQRLDSGSALLAYCGIESDQPDRNPAIQRNFPL